MRDIVVLFKVPKKEDGVRRPGAVRRRTGHRGGGERGVCGEGAVGAGREGAGRRSDVRRQREDKSCLQEAELLGSDFEFELRE